MTGERLDDAIISASLARSLVVAVEGIGVLQAAMASGPLGPALVEAVRLIRSRQGRLIVCGIGKSGHIARKIAATMASTGTPAFFVHPTEASHGDMGMITSNDVLLALSWSGETKEFSDLLVYSKRFSVPLIALTSGVDSTLARHASVALILPRVREACPHGMAPTTSTLIQLAVGDALAMALLESSEFTADRFHELHPGGRLGSRLRYVHQIMHSGDQMPLLPRGTAMSNAILEMSAKRFGLVGVIDGDGKLVGVITDGDLRRHMADDLLGQTVDEVMTTTPKSVPPETLAAEALETMESFKITALFVVREGVPLGVIHLHDLLREGIA
ncbi:MAG: KpsF/GutQ family sugar-phosphate isomerase [Rhodospirillaceae bacterium]|nr:KpsF/GutQ family sugar-phosphate isomerase [Rhodospirillaceae bacterium]